MLNPFSSLFFFLSLTRSLFFFLSLTRYHFYYYVC
jgi:hypothetical protein